MICALAHSRCASPRRNRYLVHSLTGRGFAGLSGPDPRHAGPLTGPRAFGMSASKEMACPWPPAGKAPLGSRSTSAASSLAAARPIVVQSMTNTDTADVDATVAPGRGAGRAPAPRSCASPSTATRPRPRCRTSRSGSPRWACDVPLVGDFHYIGHKLLADHPGCAEALDKYRINPGNVGFKDKRDPQFAHIVEMAIKHDKPVRIGVNWGSLDQELLTRLMDENARSIDPVDAREVTHEAMVAVGAAVGRSAPRRSACRADQHHPLRPRFRRCRT